MKRSIAALTLAIAIAIAGNTTAQAIGDVPTPIEIAVGVSPGSSIATVADLAGVAVDRALIASRGVYVVTVEGGADAKASQHNLDAALKALGKNPAVEWAEPVTDSSLTDERFHAWPSNSPSHADDAEVFDQPAFRGLRLGQAHALTRGAGVVVAVLDSGVDVDHPLLAGRVSAGYDMVDDDADPTEQRNGLDDDADGLVDRAHGHGTFVAGVVVQVAPDVTVLPVRVLDDEGRGDLHAIVEGIDFAVEAGAHVINVSFGVATKLTSPRLQAAMKRARAAGVLVVAAAGNGGDAQKRYPAAYPDVVSVAALAESGLDVASFSSQGKWVDVAAPGVGVVSAMAGGGYVRWAGSSMAAPVVTGQLALLIELRPGLNPTKLVDLLRKSCRKVSGAGAGAIDIGGSML